MAWFSLLRCGSYKRSLPTSRTRSLRAESSAGHRVTESGRELRICSLSPLSSLVLSFSVVATALAFSVSPFCAPREHQKPPCTTSVLSQKKTNASRTARSLTPIIQNSKFSIPQKTDSVGRSSPPRLFRFCCCSAFSPPLQPRPPTPGRTRPTARTQ